MLISARCTGNVGKGFYHVRKLPVILIISVDSFGMFKDSKTTKCLFPSLCHSDIKIPFFTLRGNCLSLSEINKDK